ncbi:hypothetical protein NE237_005042 [Protea cynaroides]|uniref:EF-hand domain-containing protein n=1 Tax=Protea cynaroides TaxID=273540 RepID=A0A9Q0KJQ8_9MAGN|nr:hypothetical protein NE237_005042 [Protea cynaroides]
MQVVPTSCPHRWGLKEAASGNPACGVKLSCCLHAAVSAFGPIEPTSSEPASVRCSTDNLVLCQECDWDAHGICSISASHERSPLEDFSGCPSPLELASIWGFDICGEKKTLQPPAPPLPSTMSPQVEALIQQANKNSNGLVDFSEFVTLVAPVLLPAKSPYTEDQLRQLFQMLDCNDNGYITAVELAHSMAKLGHALTAKDLTGMIKETETDGDLIALINE